MREIFVMRRVSSREKRLKCGCHPRDAGDLAGPLSLLLQCFCNTWYDFTHLTFENNIFQTYFHDIGLRVQLHGFTPAPPCYAYAQAPLKMEGSSNHKQLLGT